MKKLILFLFIVIVVLGTIIGGIKLLNQDDQNDDNKGITTPSLFKTTKKFKMGETTGKNFTVILEKEKCNVRLREVYRENDEIIASWCGDIKIKYDNKEISLKDALNNKVITIYDFFDKMELVINDDNNAIFKYDNNKKTLGNYSFQIEKCNNSLRFMNIESKNYKCVVNQ